MNTIHKKSVDSHRQRTNSLHKMGLSRDTQNAIAETKWWVETTVSLDKNETSLRRKKEQAINIEFWKYVIRDNELMKKYLILNETYNDKNIVLKSVFINIASLKNSWIEPKEKVIKTIFKVLEMQDLAWYRKFIFKIFSKEKEKLEKRWFTEEINNTMFELAKLFEQLFINEA